MDDGQRYEAAVSKDARFDGVFFIAVTSTGIYCRPSCPAITPKRANMRFYPSAAAAQEAGFRACKRCHPDASAGSPEWNVRADLAGRAMRLISDGMVDREGVTGLARRLGYSERQVNRAVTAELGAGPLALARAQRAQTARVLTETTALPLSEIAFASGFASIRQFNATIREVFAAMPGELRERAARRRPATALGRRAGDRAGRRAGTDPFAARLPAADRYGPDAPLPGRARHSRRRDGDRRHLPQNHQSAERDGRDRTTSCADPQPPTSTASFSFRTCGTSRPRSSAAGDSRPGRRPGGGHGVPVPQ